MYLKKRLPLILAIAAAVIAAVIALVFIINKASNGKEPEVAEEEILPSGAVAPTKTGGTATLTLTDGTTVTYTIPDDHYALREDYLNLVTYAYSLQNKVTSDNLIVSGNSNSVYSSTDAITATTFSDLYAMYGQIYGESWNSVAIEETYSPIYQYVLSGEIPTTPYANYALNELDSITKGDITYRVFEQDYDAESNLDADQDTIQHVHQIAAYSNTEDVIEIIVDVESGETKDALKLLNTFIGV